MFKKIHIISLLLLLSIGLLGCTTKDNDEQVTPNEEDEIVENNEGDEIADNNENEGEEDDFALVLNTLSTEKINRTIEGMDEEVEVINYEIEPYGIRYQLDESFDTPEVDQNKIVYSTGDGEYTITLEMFKDSNLEEVASDLQTQFDKETYDQVSELEDTPAEENEWDGKMQFFAYPAIDGFYAYDIAGDVLAITYHYPAEGGDGMGPLLKSLRTSIEKE